MTRTPTRYLTGFGLVFASYFAMGKLGLSLDAVSGVAAAVWAPSGIALAALLLGGLSLWPAVALAAFAVNASADVPVLAALGICGRQHARSGRRAPAPRAPLQPLSRARSTPSRDALVLIALAGLREHHAERDDRHSERLGRWPGGSG